METLTNNSGHDTDTSGCNLCKIITQHFCRKCNIPVCNHFCSIPDPSSDNEAHGIHKANNKRCIMKSSFECPSCEKIFDQSEDSEQHMLDHDQDSSLRLRFNYSTSHLYVKCKNCGKTCTRAMNVHLVL